MGEIVDFTPKNGDKPMNFSQVSTAFTAMALMAASIKGFGEKYPALAGQAGKLSDDLANFAAALIGVVVK